MSQKSLFFTLLFSCSVFFLEAEDWQPPPAAVYVSEALKKDFPIYYSTVGQLKPADSVDVRAQAAGYLRESPVSSGQEVAEGDLLFTLDAYQYEAQLEEAQAALERDRQALEYTQAQYDRSFQLHSSQAISEVELKVMAEKIDMAKSHVRMAEARVKAAALPVEHCQVRAPINGRLDSIHFSQGSYINVQDLLVTIDDIRNLTLVFSLPEMRFQELRAQLLKENLSCELWAPKQADRRVQGKIHFYANTIDKETAAITMKAEVSNEDYTFWPGQFVKLRLLNQLLSDAIVLPSSCVKLNSKGPYVFVVTEESVAEMRSVVLGPEVGDEIVILEGLEGGEKVIRQGQINVWPGTKVDIKEPQGREAQEDPDASDDDD